MQQKFDERNHDLLININGQLLHRSVAGVSPFDSVVQGGDAVWEGLRLYRGRIFRLPEHLRRLTASAKALAFCVDPGRGSDHHADPAHARGQPDARRRAYPPDADTWCEDHLGDGPSTQSVGSDPDRARRAQSAGLLDTGAVTHHQQRAAFSARLSRSKIHHNNLLQSILAKIEANVAGADDALMLDMRGFVAETNATHVFAVEQGRARTSRTVACPEGITRATVLELCSAHAIAHEVTDLSLTDLYRADELFCTGTMGEIAAVTQLDGRVIGDGEVGLVTQRIAALYRELTARDGTQVVAVPGS